MTLLLSLNYIHWTLNADGIKRFRATVYIFGVGDLVRERTVLPKVEMKDIASLDRYDGSLGHWILVSVRLLLYNTLGLESDPNFRWQSKTLV